MDGNILGRSTTQATCAKSLGLEASQGVSCDTTEWSSERGATEGPIMGAHYGGCGSCFTLERTFLTCDSV